MSTARERIKSCPFCGSKELQICRTNKYACWVSCDKCGADAKSDQHRVVAIQNWNRRKRATRAEIVFDDED